ncbi:hypothetical protein Cgig2_018771 [Carnegiea gigantea]|uniref:Uncharacterized protein n=1 Tax=Carnegiea gigantea TaxID=171969 RepID=A0A9Q1JNR6_9CARY|nr:hypothetical protein Cgig2_018771 [Carnegiea gigantea]
MLSKNKYEILNDDATLGYEKLSYLIALRYTCIYSADNLVSGRMYLVHLTFVLGPHPTMMPCTFGLPFLFKNTKSTAMLPSISLHLNKFMTKKYQDWWSNVTISDPRANVGLLQKSAGYDPSKGHVLKDESDFDDQDSDADQTNESSDIQIANRGFRGSDQDSKANFKHRGYKKRRTVAANTYGLLRGDSFFNNIQSCSEIQTNLENVPCFLCHA